MTDSYSNLCNWLALPSSPAAESDRFSQIDEDDEELNQPARDHDEENQPRDHDEENQPGRSAGMQLQYSGTRAFVYLLPRFSIVRRSHGIR